jgi:hypothetical protein
MTPSLLSILAEMHVLSWPVVWTAVVGVVALAVWGIMRDRNATRR